MVTKRNITEAAFRLFAAKGFYETTTDNIAQVLGLKKQSLYSHFKSKNEIILAVLREQTDNIDNEIDVVIAEYRDKSVEMLLKFIFARIAIYMSLRDRLLLWKRLFLVELNSELSDFLRDFNWQFLPKLTDELGAILSSRYMHFSNPEMFSSFFSSYMVMINGYLDLMLMTGYDSNSFESTWKNFWYGTKSMF